MKKEDLQTVKSATASRVPDCFQKTPRRVSITTSTAGIADTAPQQILTISVDTKGIHAIVRTGSKLHYCLHNLNTGRLEHDSIFPTDINAFLGLSQNNVSLTCANETNDSVLILRDGNSTIYPLVKDCLDAIRDPHWLDLQPIKCLAATTVTLNSVGANQKSQVAILALVPEPQLLMQRILRCDYKGFKSILNQIEANVADSKSQIAAILNERCDGNRNILHACVSMCSPTSNKDNDDATTTTNLPGSNLSSSSHPALDCNLDAQFPCYQVSTYDLICPSLFCCCSECLWKINQFCFFSSHSQIPSASSNLRDNRVSLREMMRRARDIDSLPSNANANAPSQDESSFPSSFPSYWPSEYELNSGDEDSLTGMKSKLSRYVNALIVFYHNLNSLRCLEIFMLLTRVL